MSFRKKTWYLTIEQIKCKFILKSKERFLLIKIQFV